MGKTKFGILHKYTITVMGTKYRIKHLELPSGSDYCDHCCCSNKPNNRPKCSHKQRHDKDFCLGSLVQWVNCDRTIGVHCVLKHINHVKNKV